MTTMHYNQEVELTPRQKQVGRLISQGLTNEEVSAELGISPRTVKAHADVLRDKLDVPKRRLIGQRLRDLGLA